LGEGGGGRAQLQCVLYFSFFVFRFPLGHVYLMAFRREDGTIDDGGDEVYYGPSIMHKSSETRDMLTEAVAAKFLELRRKNVSTTLEHDRRHIARYTTLGAPVSEGLVAARTPNTEMVEDRSSLISAGSLSPVERSHFVVRFMRNL